MRELCQDIMYMYLISCHVGSIILASIICILCCSEGECESMNSELLLLCLHIIYIL